MASVAFDLFLPEVLLEVDAVPTPVAINAIRNACFDFCRDSHYLTAEHATIPLVANTPEYTLTAPTDTQVLTARLAVLDDGTTIYPWTVDDVVAARPSWRTRTGQVSGFVMVEPNVLRTVAVPEAAGTLNPLIVLAPTRAATTVDARMYNLHLETIKYGALWKLKSQAGKPWSDLGGAKENESLFLMGVNAATIERQRSNSNAVVQVSPRPFL
jgi:hypothetical protein